MSANRQAALESETSERDVTKPKDELEYVEIGPIPDLREGTGTGQDSEELKYVEIGPIPDLREGTGTGQDSEELEYVEIGPLLRDLRGDLSLRQLEEETGIAYSYLSVIERGNKRPGPRVLSRLAAYHDVPLDELLGAAGYPQQPNEDGNPTIADIQRSFRFLVEDPELEEFQKPSEAAPIDLKRFAIQLYEHYTGKRLLNRRPTT